MTFGGFLIVIPNSGPISSRSWSFSITASTYRTRRFGYLFNANGALSQTAYHAPMNSPSILRLNQIADFDLATFLVLVALWEWLSQVEPCGVRLDVPACCAGEYASYRWTLMKGLVQRNIRSLILHFIHVHRQIPLLSSSLRNRLLRI